MASSQKRPAMRVFAVPATMVFGALALSGVVVAHLPPPWWVSSGILATTVIAGFVFLLRASRASNAPPAVVDLAFLLGLTAYYLYPALFAGLGLTRVASTYAMQQGLMTSCAATFLFLRSWLGFGHWQKMARVLTAPVHPIQWRALLTLAVLTLVWLVIASATSEDYLRTSYGFRAPGQRSSATIPLLGFTYFGITAASVLLLHVVHRPARYRWLGAMVIFMLLFGVICVFIFGTRTRLLWSVALALCPLLLLHRLRFSHIVALCFAVLLLLPVFDFIGRARAGFDYLDERTLAHTQRSLRSTAASPFERMVNETELMAITHNADVMVHAFREEVFLGRFIGRSILQAPPAFVLRLFDFDRVDTLSRRYVELIDPSGFAAGKGYGLALSAELYCNFRRMGGIVGGLILFIFCRTFEAFFAAVLPPWLAYPTAVSFMLNVARVNSRGLETLAKVMLVLVIFAVMWLSVFTLWMMIARSVRSAPRWR